MMSNYILNEKGEPEICKDTLIWGKWFGDFKNRRVKEDYLDFHGKQIHVSTVFLGLNHRFSWLDPKNNDPKPILWETMIFGHEKFEDFQERYCSKDGALKGHSEAIAMVKRNMLTIVDGNKKGADDAAYKNI